MVFTLISQSKGVIYLSIVSRAGHIQSYIIILAYSLAGHGPYVFLMFGGARSW